MATKKLLITGFAPFNNQSINPSWQSVKELADQIGDYQVTKLQIPTVFDKAVECVLDKAKQIDPDVIICVGLAGGRSCITPEVVAINLIDATIPDNEGNQPQNTPILTKGENAYFTTLPVKKIVEELKNANIPSALSYSAGVFVCNQVLYRLLHHYKDTKVKVGFIHLPFLPEQTDETKPSMPKAQMVQALTIAIQSI